jgi:hypothetical protein
MLGLHSVLSDTYTGVLRLRIGDNKYYAYIVFTNERVAFEK